MSMTEEQAREFDIDIEQDRQEFRDWMASGMPPHPIFAPEEDDV